MKREAKKLAYTLLAVSALTFAGCGGGGGSAKGSVADPVANNDNTQQETPSGSTNTDSFLTSYDSSVNEAAPNRGLSDTTNTTVDGVTLADAVSSGQSDYPPSPPVIRR